MSLKSRLSGVMTLFLLSGTWCVAENTPVHKVDFMRQIRPILSQKCGMCHGPDEETREGGLRLDTKLGAFAEADSGLPAIVPGNPDESELLVRITSHEDGMQMPPAESGKELSAAEIKLIRQWIQEGAEFQEHWSFQAPVAHQPPAVQNKAWVRNEIDQFVLALLEARQIAPSPEADRRTLIRRLTLDLTGLLPTPAEVEQFVQDERPEAYELLVNRLLASPHFGERWGRHWLDLARYADSDGYLGDTLRPYAWKYRDWVIQAINEDLPYDQFTIQQIAGDLLPEATLSQKTATGFHRNSMKNTEAGADREEDRVRQAVDRVSAVGTIWLGLTVGCAECHTHKFDPITHKEFYQMYAFFNNLEERDLPAAPQAEQEKYQKKRQDWQAEVNQVKKEIGSLLKTYNAERDEQDIVKQDDLLALLRETPKKRKKEAVQQWETFRKELSDSEQELFARYEKLAATMPAAPAEKAPTVVEASQQRVTHIHLRGDFRSPGEQVEPGTIAVLPPLQKRDEMADRLDLARWLVSAENPLTPRTAVNQIWQHLFGRGLVNTVDDFGATGDAPSHPKLLDWLAVTLREQGWSRKRLIKTIVMSATYRQVSHERPDLVEIDPYNTLLARQSRFRLEAEVIRDVSLAASGLLNTEIGGPSIRPVMNTQITEISRNKDWKVSPGTEKYRRGLYILYRRGTPYPMLTTFDAPDSTVACARRERSNSPLQSLTLLNDPVFYECAQHLGKRLAEETGHSVDDWINYSFQICLGRAPETEEVQRLLEYVAEQQEFLQDLDESQLKELVGEPIPKLDLQEQAERVVLARVLLNLDEFITRE